MAPYRSQWLFDDVAVSAGSLPHCYVVESHSALERRRLALAEGRTVHLLTLESVLWISAAAGRICIHRASSELIARGTLGSLTRALGADFQRINRNTTVNMAAVNQVRHRGRHGEGAVMLYDGRQLPLTRLYARGLRAWLAGRGDVL